MRTLLIRHCTGAYPVVIGKELSVSLARWLKTKKLGPRLVIVSHAELFHLFEPELMEVLSGALR